MAGADIKFSELSPFVPTTGDSIVGVQLQSDTTYLAKKAKIEDVRGEAVAALAIAAGGVNIDLSSGDYFTLAATANVTSLTFSNLPAAGYARTILIEIKQDATGTRTLALPASFKAIAGSDTAIQAAANSLTYLAATTLNQGTTWNYSMKAGTV